MVKASPQEPERKGIFWLLEQGGCRSLGSGDPELEDVVVDKNVASSLGTSLSLSIKWNDNHTYLTDLLGLCLQGDDLKVT